MSRNIGDMYCERCGSLPVLVEPPRAITPYDAGGYFADYDGMLVANARCHDCGALYLAWCDESSRRRYPRDTVSMHGMSFFDLSYRSTFNDEPGPDDLPPWTPLEEQRMVAAGWI